MTDKWSQDVTEHSDALDLDEGVFTWRDPKRIARSLKASAEKSKRRKGSPLQSAMSMLTFYINRAGKDLDSDQKRVLEQARMNCAKRSARGSRIGAGGRESFKSPIKTSLVSANRMIHIRSVARYGPLVLQQAKGGDPMSHGSAMGSVQFVRETHR